MTSSGKTLVLPKGVDYRDLQELLDSDPNTTAVLAELQDLIQHVTPVDAKLLLNKMGIINETSRMTFREFIEKALAPYHPEVAEVHKLHEEWIQLIEVVYPEDNVLLFAPVDSWKSTMMGVTYPLYLMHLNCDIRVGIISETETLSKRRIIQCRRIIEDNPELPLLGVEKPQRPSEWGEKSFTIVRNTTVGDPTMRAYGVDGAIQGHKMDLGIFDDIVSIENSRTEASRDTIRDKVKKEVLSRLTKRPPPPLKASRFIAIGTAFHQDDLMHEFGKGFEDEEPVFKEIRRKAIYDESSYTEAPQFVQLQMDRKKYQITRKDHPSLLNNLYPGDDGPVNVGVLFPEHLSLAQLEKEMKKGERFFRLNYLQEPLDDEMSFIEPAWVEACYKPNMVMGPHLWHALKKHGFKLFFCLDPAVSRNKREAEKRDTDFWVMQACGYNEQLDMRAIFDFRRSRGTSKKNLIAGAREFYDSFMDPVTPGKIVMSSDLRMGKPKWFVENISAQDYLVQDFEVEFGKTCVFGINTQFVSKNSGLNGLPAVSLNFEKKAYMIPTGDTRSIGYAEILKKEASGYLTVKHDDIFMVQFLMEQAITKLGYRVKSGNPNKIGMPVPARGFKNLPTAQQLVRRRESAQRLAPFSGQTQRRRARRYG